MKELLKKLKLHPLADNKAAEVEKILERYEDLRETWLPKIKHLVEMKWENKQEVNKWDWMYDKITNAILIYYCFEPHLGEFVNDKGEVFKLKLPIPIDPWRFETKNEYDLVGTLDGKIKIITVKGIDLTRHSWGDYRLKIKEIRS